MHLTVMQFGQSQLGAAECAGKRVLEVGARNVNGSLRQHVSQFGPSSYVGIDPLDGPGVQVVMTVQQAAQRWGRDQFELIICTSTLEHVEDWRGAVSAMKRLCKPGGTILLTVPGPAAMYHGEPEDFWRFTQSDMYAIWRDCELLACEPDPIWDGAMVKIRKPEDFREVDLTAYEVMAVERG
jgi:SAM-dependent methyltransferase